MNEHFVFLNQRFEESDKLNFSNRQESHQMGLQEHWINQIRWHFQKTLFLVTVFVVIVICCQEGCDFVVVKRLALFG